MNDELKKTFYRRCKICGVFCINSYCAKHHPEQRKLNLIIKEDESLKRVLDKAREFGFDDEEKRIIQTLLLKNGKNF